LQIWTGFWLRGVQSLSNMRSFAPLAFRPSAIPVAWTCCSSRTKQDFHCNDNLISRVKLTCLTTV